MSYPACPSEGCNKKVLESGTGWRCEKCDRSYPEPDYRYILSLTASDYSGQTWLQAFNDVGVQIMGMPANELLQLKDSDESAFLAYIQSRLFSMYDIRIRIKTENYNEETKVRCTIMTATPIDYAKACGELAEMIQGYHI
jgi:replication factor A1